MALVALAVGFGPVAARSGPLYDPWLESFQVGATSDVTGPLDDGFPAGLLEPARPDTAWVRGALRCLDPDRPAAPGTDLTRRWLAARDGAGAGAKLKDAWRAAAAFGDPQASQEQLRAVDGTAILETELGARIFFSALAAGDRRAAGAEAGRLARSDAPGLEPRDAFLWSLRARRVARQLGDVSGESRTIWSEAGLLPPFDARNAWSLWLAYSRERGQPPLALPDTTEAWRSFLVSAGRGSGLRPIDLTSSGLSAPWRAAAGAALLPAADLEAHFRRYPSPPQDVDLQGMWVAGRRALRQGQSAAYEELAATPGLQPLWRLDLWRRASELRLLGGDPVRARADLDRALALARDGQGTVSLRRRLRQWVEQALVLALARRDTAAARSLREAGKTAFSGAELSAFVEETNQWEARLGGRAAAPDTTDTVTRAAWVVARGRAPAARPASDEMRAAFHRAADRPLWEQWARWGLDFADSSGTGREAAYARRLGALRGSADPAAGVLAAIAPLLDEPRLLGQMLDADVAILTRGATAPRPSLVPALVQSATGDHVRIHALLGFALASGDMRGALAAASVLPQRSLTAGARRLFLYPLPGPGPVRDALLGADSEPALLLAVARNESLFEPAARSRAGALGWMQIMPFHYERRGALPGAAHWSNAPVSIGKGDRLLSDAWRRYRGDPYRMLAAYNAGPEATDRWDRQLGGGAARDIYLAWIGYPETRHYVEKVLIDRAVYEEIIGGPSAARD